MSLFSQKYLRENTDREHVLKQEEKEKAAGNYILCLKIWRPGFQIILLIHHRHSILLFVYVAFV